MDLIDKENDVPGLDDLLDDALEALLKFSPVLRSRQHGGEVKIDHALVREHLGDVVVRDALSEALDNRRLSDAGLADNYGVVLGLAAEDLDDSLDF